MTHSHSVDALVSARRSAIKTRSWVLLAAAVSLAACDHKDMAGAEPSATDVAAAPSAEAAADGARSDSLASQTAPDADDATISRKLIQRAELHLEVSSYASARTQIEENLAELGGFIANARVEHADGSVSHADLTIRVPSDKLDDFLAGTAGHGDVTYETVSSEDVTEGYYDIQARLKNAKRLEVRLLDLLDNKGDSVKSLLEVERELARVRGEIEGFEGKLRLWDNQVSLSTVELRLVTKQVYSVSVTPTLGDEIASTFGGSWSALKTFGVALLMMAVALVPWLLPLGLAGYALRALVLRIRRSRPQPPFSPDYAQGVGPGPR